MNFTALQTEVFARGFTDLNDGGAGLTRVKQWLNDAYHALCEEEEWPFLIVTLTSQTAPVSITDLRDIIYVSSATSVLEGRDISVFVDGDPDLSQTGTASYWYRDGDSLKVWPTDTSSRFTVRYIKVPADLSSGTDTPVVPTRYHNLIVDYAVIRALKDRSNFEEAQNVWQAIQPDLARMRETLLDQASWYQRQTDAASG